MRQLLKLGQPKHFSWIHLGQALYSRGRLDRRREVYEISPDYIYLIDYTGHIHKWNFVFSPLMKDEFLSLYSLEPGGLRLKELGLKL